MEVKNCKGCGRLFNYMGGAPLCDGCRKKFEQKFQEVKQYLDENPNASVNQVSEDNDVSVKQIKQWIREERLSLSEASLDGVTCEHCGRPIRTGRFCEKCKAAMANSFANSIEKPKPLEPQKKERDGNKMRLDRKSTRLNSSHCDLSRMPSSA